MSRACPTPIKSVCVTLQEPQKRSFGHHVVPWHENPQCPVIITRFHSQTFEHTVSKLNQIWSGVIGIQVRRELGQVWKLQAYRTVLAFFSSAMFAMSHQPNSSGVIITRFPLISEWCLAMGCSGTKSRLILMILSIEFAPLCKKKMTLPNTASKHYILFMIVSIKQCASLDINPIQSQFRMRTHPQLNPETANNPGRHSLYFLVHWLTGKTDKIRVKHAQWVIH